MKSIGYDMHAGRTAMPASIEIAPRQALESRDLPGLFPPGTKTYLCDVGVDPVKEFVRAVRRVRDLGYEPVPHIPARRMRSHAELRDRVQAYAEEGGASDVLVIGGGLTRPAGPYSSTMEVLSTGILDRHDFGDGRARYEAAPEAHHDHLIDVETGKVVEFVDPEIEALQKQIAAKLGYRLVDHRLELYGVRLDREG